MATITTPVTVVSGFLGAGKTTLINRLLRESHGERLAVIENEYGAVGVDAEFLVTDQNEAVIQLANGCLCCTVRGDLARALHELATRSDAGDFHFDRVLIETTGIADPGPIIQTFLAETAILTRFHLDGVVTLVDAVHGLAQLADSGPIETRAQLAYADRVLLTKCDLADATTQGELAERLTAINPRAQRLAVDLHRVPMPGLLALLIDAHGYTFDHISPDEVARMSARVPLAREAQAGPDADGAARYQPVRAAPHTAGVVSCVYESPEAMDLQRLNVFFDALVQRYGARLWRCKGIVQAEQQRQRLVVQGVQTLLQIHGGALWRAREPRRTVLVFIGVGLDRAWITAALRSCEAGFMPA